VPSSWLTSHIQHTLLLQGHVVKLDSKLDEAKNSLGRLAEEKEALDGELVRLKQLHARQELSKEDVLRMKSAQKKLSDQVIVVKRYLTRLS
jgi:hypothetical protein